MEAKSLTAGIGRWPSRLKNYINDLQTEMRRVTFPGWKQVRATTLVVLAAVFAFAAYFALVDLVVGRAIGRVFDALTK